MRTGTKSHFWTKPFTYMAGIFFAFIMISFQSTASNSGETEVIKIDDVFGDHMVLQRDKPIKFRGAGPSNSELKLEFAGEVQKVTIDESQRWELSFPPVSEPGPFELKINNEVKISDILMGDVFLCSGQSNMEFPIYRALNPDRELGSEHDSDIRLLTIPKDTHIRPQNNFQTPQNWEIASADTLHDFSAVCYFTARDLKADVNAPIGLIDASWGGTRIESWMSAESLRATGSRADDLDLLDIYREDSAAGLAAFGEKWNAWWRAQNPSKEPVWSEPLQYKWRPVPNFTSWKTWGRPSLQDYNGQVWFRTKVVLTPEQVQATQINLGSIDELDHVWINGQRIGSQFNWGGERRYPIPPNLLKVGPNNIVVNVFSAWDKGGMFGPAETVTLTSLSGAEVPLPNWYFHKADAPGMDAPLAPWESVTGITGIHNAMIAPLRDIGLKGGLWYQGESNADDAEGYGRYLIGLIEGWHKVVSHGVKTLVIQLPEFGSAATEPIDSGWAQIREAQRKVATSSPDVALVVTLGAGDRYDIHPPNKQEVARRTANAARTLFYGKDIPNPNREPLTAKKVAGEIVVEFSGKKNKLIAWSSNTVIGFELCNATSCQFSTAKIDGSRLILPNPEGFDPTRVRYNWADVPFGNLADESGRPVGPFEMEII